MAKIFLNIISVLIVFQFFLRVTVNGVMNKGYRFKLDIGNPNVYCPKPNYKCQDDKLHYLCRNDTYSVHPRCKNYRHIPMTQNLRKSFVEGTNGIRNKVAVDFGLSNMNLVYWSDELSGMARRFLSQCLLMQDPCLMIGQKFINVSQNLYFFKGQITGRWPGRMVRHWFIEIGHNVKTWRDYKKKHKQNELGNITNLIYPLAEFVGCGAARMFNGYFIVCYYHPAYERKIFPEKFHFGMPCTNCSEERPVCSRNFIGLCGVDLEINGASVEKLSIFIPFIFIILFVIRNIQT